MKQKKLTSEDGKRALMHHVVERAMVLREQYGNFIDYEVLLKILTDSRFVRYPTLLEFNSQPIDDGLFAIAIPFLDDNSFQRYVIYVHEYFKDKLDDVPALVLYHLVMVNYGDIVTGEEAELFGATVLGMEKEEYYQLLCRFADQVSKPCSCKTVVSTKMENSI